MALEEAGVVDRSPNRMPLLRTWTTTPSTRRQATPSGQEGGLANFEVSTYIFQAVPISYRWKHVIDRKRFRRPPSTDIFVHRSRIAHSRPNPCHRMQSLSEVVMCLQRLSSKTTVLQLKVARDEAGKVIGNN